MESDAKLKELILYISEKCASQSKYGAVKLNKILYFSDFLYFAVYGSPITGVEYQKLEHGPAPKRLVPLREELIQDGSLAIQNIQLISGGTMKKPVNLRRADLSLFSASEIAVVDQVIEAVRGATADRISELSHRKVGWKVARDREVIPYSTIFLSDEPLTDSETARGRELAERAAA